MSQFTVKLINFGLTFPNYDCRIRVQDIQLPSKPIPILWQHYFNSWAHPENEELGSANIYTENFNLFADCYFDDKVMLAQPKHDHIVIRHPDKLALAFNSLSIMVDRASIEKSSQNELSPNMIKNAHIKNLSLVQCIADPGVFLETNSDQFIIYTGPTINKNILI